MGAESMVKAKADAGNEFMYAWGPAESAMSGELIYGENSRPVTIAKAGDYTVTINMMEGTFAVKAYSPKLYAVGGFNGWGHNVNVFIYERNGGVHSGLVDMSKAGNKAFEFKFSTQPNWNEGSTAYGVGAEANLLSTDPGAKNLKLDKGGIYYFKVDTDKMTWEAMEITSFELSATLLLADGTLKRHLLTPEVSFGRVRLLSSAVRNTSSAPTTNGTSVSAVRSTISTRTTHQTSSVQKTERMKLRSISATTRLGKRQL